MKQARKGLIFPMILCFMIVSQLIYLGICHLNSLDRQRSQQMIHHYQLATQEQFALSWLEEHLQDLWQEQFKVFFEENLAQLISDNLLTNDLHPASLQPTLLAPMLIIEDSHGQEYLLLQEASVKWLSNHSLTSREELNYLIDAPMDWQISPENSGHHLLLNQNRLDELYSLIDEGYILLQTYERDDDRKWLGQLENPITFHFSTGSCQIFPDQENMRWVSQLANGLSHEKTKPLPKIDYRVEWKAYLLYLPTEDL